jgi:hypothetical protein
MLRRGQLERQKRQDEYYLGGGGGGTMTAPAATGAAPGAALKSATGVPADAPPPGKGKFAEWSQQYGIPVDALVSDYFSNGGKGIAEMLFKRGAPDVQLVNGVAIDKNKTANGQILPFVNTSSNGTTTVGQVGPDNRLTVSAPDGAVNTARDYARAQAGLKPIKIFNPITQREEYSNEAAVAEGGGPQPSVNTGRLAPMAGARGNVQSAGYSGGDRNAANAESIRIMQAELRDPALTPADRAGIQREIQRMQLQSGMTNAQVAQSGNVAAGPSAAEVAQNEANKVRAVDTAKADVVRNTEKQTAGKLYGQMTSVAQQAMKLLDASPTGSGAGALADSALNFVGQPTKGGNVAQSLEAVAGWMVANVPRMEGPQSNADVLNYQTMAGRVGDRTLPAETRKAALREVIALQNKYAELNGGSKSQETQSSGLPSGWSVKVK